MPSRTCSSLAKDSFGLFQTWTWLFEFFKNSSRLFKAHLISLKTYLELRKTILELSEIRHNPWKLIYDYRDSFTLVEVNSWTHYERFQVRLRLRKTLLFVKCFWFQYFSVGGSIIPIASNVYPHLVLGNIKVVRMSFNVSEGSMNDSLLICRIQILGTQISQKLNALFLISV